MPSYFARHEQFLRIFALLDILSNARQPLDDASLINALKERLGLSRLSARTLHRDCDFLVSCGYPISHMPLAGDRRYGWQFAKDATVGRRIPVEPVTLLELASFMVARDLLRTCEGTILWSGIESLREKIERGLPADLRVKLDQTSKAFHVPAPLTGRYADRPRLLSALAGAILEYREIEIDASNEGAGGADGRIRLRPLRLVIEPPTVRLLCVGCPGDDAPRLIDIEGINHVEPLDTTFDPVAIDAAAMLDAIARGRAT